MRDHPTPLKICSKAGFKSKSQNILTVDNSVFPYSNAKDMRVTQDLNSFGVISLMRNVQLMKKKYIPCVPHKNNCKKKIVHTT